MLLHDCADQRIHQQFRGVFTSIANSFHCLLPLLLTNDHRSVALDGQAPLFLGQTSTCLATLSYLALTYVWSQRSDTPVTLAIPANGSFSNSKSVNQIFGVLPNYLFRWVLHKLSATVFALKVLLSIMDFAVFHHIT